MDYNQIICNFAKRYIKVAKVMKGLGISAKNCYLLINCRTGLIPSK